MARSEREKGFVEKSIEYLTVGGLVVALVGVIFSEAKLVGLGIAALVGGLLGKSLLSSKPQNA